MRKRITDEELGRLLRALPEESVPPMAPLRLPPRPAPLAGLPWRREEIALLAAAIFALLLGAGLLTFFGPGVVAAYAVQIFAVPGAPGITLLEAALAAALGWLVVSVTAPHPRV